MPATIRLAEIAPRQEKLTQNVKNILKKKDLSVASGQLTAGSETTDH
jgi:hypothetical protein